MNQHNSSSIVAIDSAYSEKIGINLPIDQFNQKYTIDEFSDMRQAWYNHVKDTWELLIDLRIPDQKQWMVKVEDAGLAANLISDLINMSCWIPFQGKEMDMRKVAYTALIVCPDHHELAKFFK